MTQHITKQQVAAALDELISTYAPNEHDACACMGAEPGHEKCPCAERFDVADWLQAQRASLGVAAQKAPYDHSLTMKERNAQHAAALEIAVWHAKSLPDESTSKMRNFAAQWLSESRDGCDSLSNKIPRLKLPL
tara:strand:- start:276 stop:677 length:402 start_codon:yes stop_codon:yes gene_type:complete